MKNPIMYVWPTFIYSKINNEEKNLTNRSGHHNMNILFDLNKMNSFEHITNTNNENWENTMRQE